MNDDPVVLSAPGGGNAPGDLVCPPWLLLLDDPEVQQVLFVGTPPEQTQTWFDEQDAVIHRLDAASIGQPIELMIEVDLVVVGSDALAAVMSADGMWWLRSVCPSDATAWWLPTPIKSKVARALGAVGFASLRQVQLPNRRKNRAEQERLGLVAHIAGPNDRLPTWAADACGDPPMGARRTGALRPPGRYPSQKAVMMVRDRPDGPPVTVIKSTRHSRFNGRLLNEYLMLAHIVSLGGPLAQRVPHGSELIRVGHLVAIAQQALSGGPFTSASSFTPDCALAADAVVGIGELARTRPRLVRGAEVGDPMRADLRAFNERMKPSDEVASFLSAQVERIARAPEIPAVLWHGDLGSWNLWVDDDRVRFLDWESAARVGPPLWDLFYFLRSYAVRSGRRRGIGRMRAIDRHFLRTSPLNNMASHWVSDYVRSIDLDPTLVEPLFHTCWMHRATKEGSRLSPDQPGHYGPLCSLLVEQRNAPGLESLLDVGSDMAWLRP